jgi:hypothetical protein
MSPTAAASPRLLPPYTDFCPFQSYILSFCAPVFLLLASASCSWVISLSLSLSSLFFFFFFTHRPLRLPPLDAIYFDSRVGGRGAMGCGAASKARKARMATRLKPLLGWRASEPASEPASERERPRGQV